MLRRAGRRILGAGRDRGHAISGRGFNHFNLLRRHFRATGGGAAETCAPPVSFVPSATRREATEIFGRWSWRFQYQILGVQGSGAHTISGREFNLFKALRRHSRANPLCRQALPRRGQNAAVHETDDRVSRPGLRQARHAPRLDPSVASGSSGNGNSFDGTGHSAFSFRAAERNKCRTVIQPCQENVGRFGGGESTPVSTAISKTNGRATRSQPTMPPSNSKAYPLHRTAPLATTCPAVSISPTLTRRSMQEGFCDGASQNLKGSSRNRMSASKLYVSPGARCSTIGASRVEKAQAIEDKMPQ